MSEMVRVVVDAMGGDNAPEEIVKGAVQAVNHHENIHVILTGIQDAVERELKKYSYPADRIELVHTSEVIETAETRLYRREVQEPCWWAARGSSAGSKASSGLRLLR